MNEVPSSAFRPRNFGFVLFVILLGVGAWIVLEANRPWAKWVTFSSPSTAVAGQPFPVHLELASPIPAGRLGIDLHGRGGSSPSRRSTVVGVFSTELQPGQGSYRVEIPLNPRATSRFVRAVIYLSPTGHWKDRLRSANTEDFDLLPAGSSASTAAARITAQRVFDLGGVSVVPRVRSWRIRTLTTTLWLAAFGILALRLARTRGVPVVLEPGRRPLAETWLCVAFLIAAVADGFDLSRALGDVARRLAHRLSAYESRVPGQQLISALAIAALVGASLTLFRCRMPIPLRIAAAAVTCALGLVCLDSLSLHAIDEIAEKPCWGWPLIQWANLTCAVMALVGIQLARPPGSAPP